MSLLTNNNTIHLYNRWISPWYENNSTYSNLIYSDLYIYEFINGIYYQLKMPSSIINIRELNFNQIIIRLNLYLFKKRKQKRSSLFFNNKVEFFLFYKKINYLLHKALFINKQYKKKYKYDIFLFNFKKIRKKIKKKKYLILLRIIKKKNIIKHLNGKYKYKKYLKNKYLKNKKKKLFLINKYIYNNMLKAQLVCSYFLNKFCMHYLNSSNKVLYIFNSGSYYKTYNFKKKYSKLIKYNNKNLLKYYYYIKKKKDIFIARKNFRKKKENVYNFVTKYKNDIKKIAKLKVVKRRKIFYGKKLKNKKNKKKFISKNSIVQFFRKRKMRNFIKFLSKYNLKKKNFNKLNILKMRIYRNIFKKWHKLNRCKYINILKTKKLLYYFNQQKSNSFSYNRKKSYLKKKLFLTNKKLILRRFRNKNNKKKRNKIKNKKLYFKVKTKKKKYLSKLKIKKTKYKLEHSIRKYKKKKSKKLRRILMHKNMNFYLFFWIYKKLINWYYLLIIKLLVINNLITFSNKTIVPLVFYRLNINFTIIKNKILTRDINLNKLIYLNRKKLKKKYNWFNNFYLRLMLYHLRLKISDTLGSYLHNNVLFFPYYKKKFFVLQDVKLMCDFIKLKLQYGRSIVRILRKIIKIHNYQRLKLRIRNRRYRLKMINFKKKIRNRIIRKFRLIKSRSNLLSGKDKYEKVISRYNFNSYKKTSLVDIEKSNSKLNSGIYLNKLNLRLFVNKNNLNLNNNNNKLNVKLNNIVIKKYKLNKRKKRIRLVKRLTKWRKKFKYLNYKNYPLIGIRVECNGPTKKGKRTKMITYNEWVNYYKLPGKMPYSTKMADVHYWQSYARTKRAAIGIKIWLFFNTSLNSLNIGKVRKNIKYKL